MHVVRLYRKLCSFAYVKLFIRCISNGSLLISFREKRYDLASGDSYFRQGDLGRALKRFLAVEKHYTDISEDQFDFHSYCLRKMTLRSYVDMLKFQDRLHSFPYFHKAAIRAIR